MEIEVMNSSLESIGIIDIFESLIWTERYCGAGEFEFYAPYTEDDLNLLQPGNYLSVLESKQVMIVEKIRIETNTESGNHLVVSGRSLESLLERRIIWVQTSVSGNVQNAIKKLLTENAISPDAAHGGSSRAIPGLIFVASTDQTVTSLTMESAQFTGDNLYDAIEAICEVFGLGFRITISGSNMRFQLYNGKNRSYTNLDGTDQVTNPWVIFSPEFDSLLSSDYSFSTEQLKTVALVAGEGEGTDRKRAVISVSDASGLDRRELFVDARDISSTDGEETIDISVYTQMLEARGLERLAEHTIETDFDADIGTVNPYEYGSDFELGDIVQIENEHGVQSRVRVSEFIYSEGTSGLECHPTFSAI